MAGCLPSDHILKNATDSDSKIATVMNSRHVSKILLIQALEQSDPQARYISHSTRQRATQHAKKRSSHEPPSSTESSIQFFTNRAESLWNFLSTSYPMITESFRGAQATIPYTIVAIPAFAAGLLINGLGTSQRVNLLNFPLLILLLWNIGTYASTILLPLLGKDLTGPLLRHLSKGFATATEWLGKGPWPKIALPGRADREWILQSTERFMNLWWRHCHPIIISRVRHLLHIGAACLALGIILSMYVRGLVLDYQATWESTFLSAAQVHTVLHGLLGPAAWLLGFPFPPAEDLAHLQAPGQGSAALVDSYVGTDGLCGNRHTSGQSWPGYPHASHTKPRNPSRSLSMSRIICSC